MPTPQVTGAVNTQQAPALSKHMLAEEARQIKENTKSQRNAIKQMMNYIHSQFQFFRGVVFLFRIAENNVIKRNVKSTQKEKKH